MNSSPNLYLQPTLQAHHHLPPLPRRALEFITTEYWMECYVFVCFVIQLKYSRRKKIFFSDRNGSRLSLGIKVRSEEFMDLGVLILGTTLADTAVTVQRVAKEECINPAEKRVKKVEFLVVLLASHTRRAGGVSRNA